MQDLLIVCLLGEINYKIGQTDIICLFELVVVNEKLITIHVIRKVITIFMTCKFLEFAFNIVLTFNMLIKYEKIGGLHSFLSCLGFLLAKKVSILQGV